MAQTGQRDPGDVANAFVRVLLSDAGRLVGGLSDGQWKCTLKYFGHRCAYTGEEGKLVKEHAIPINRTHCGLHLFGNVVPATKKANDAKGKGNKDYKEFLKDDEDRLRKIEQFMEYARYRERAKPFDDIQRFCQTQYDPGQGTIGAVAKDYIEQGFSDEEVLERIVHTFPEGNTSIKSIMWYRSRMRKTDRSIPTNRELLQRNSM